MCQYKYGTSLQYRGSPFKHNSDTFPIRAGSRRPETCLAFLVLHLGAWGHNHCDEIFMVFFAPTEVKAINKGDQPLINIASVKRN